LSYIKDRGSHKLKDMWYVEHYKASECKCLNLRPFLNIKNYEVGLNFILNVAPYHTNTYNPRIISKEINYYSIITERTTIGKYL
jgi:hypothetical protein